MIKLVCARGGGTTEAQYRCRFLWKLIIKQWFTAWLRDHPKIPHPHWFSPDQIPHPWYMHFTQFSFDFEICRTLLSFRSDQVGSWINTITAIPDSANLAAKSTHILYERYLHRNIINIIYGQSQKNYVLTSNFFFLTHLSVFVTDSSSFTPEMPTELWFVPHSWFKKKTFYN